MADWLVREASQSQMILVSHLSYGAFLLLSRRHAPGYQIVISYHHQRSARDAGPRKAGMAAPMPRLTTRELPAPG